MSIEKRIHYKNFCYGKKKPLEGLIQIKLCNMENTLKNFLEPENFS